MLQILLDHLFGHLTYRRTEVPSRPKMPAPIAFLQVRVLFKQLARRPPFDPPHDLARRHIRRTTDQNMHMILAHHPFHDPDLKGLTRLPNQLSYSLGDLSGQYLVPVLRHPDKVILNLKYRVASVSVVHAAPPFPQHILAAKADRLKPVV